MVALPRHKHTWISFGPFLALVAIGGVMTLGLVFASATWASRQTNLAALERQRELVDSRLESQLGSVANELVLMADGYSDAFSNESANRGAAFPGGGKFTAILTSVFKYDAAFIVSPDGELAPDQVGDSADRYEWIKPLISPILRRAVESVSEGYPGPGSQKAGTVELMRLQGRPSIAGVVPIYGGEAKNQGVPGFFLVAYRYLDGAALDALSHEQGLNGARFARSSDPGPEEVTFQIEATAGKEPIGFIIWTPDLPGSKVVVGLIPALLVAALFIAAVVAALVILLRKSWADLQSSEQKARHGSLHDILTDLPNRGLFANRVETRLLAPRAGFRSVIALIDLDKFKSVNDTLGHAAGDETIRAAAARITALLGQNDVLARLGGDEFALFLPDVPEGDKAYLETCDRIVQSLSEPFVLLDGQAVARIGCSIGILAVPGGSEKVGDLLHLADLALYEAKASGRGRLVEYTADMDASAKFQEELKADLRACLEALGKMSESSPRQAANLPSTTLYGIEVFYQTIHQAGSDAVVSGAEALVRWHHAKYGLLTPDRFIPLAEDSGLIQPLGRYVLEQACLAATGWVATTTVCVNVSPTQLRTPDFADEVLQVLGRTGLPPSRLELEVTETALMGGDEDTVKEALQRLRRSGVKIALDDFGTGYSSLSHLIRFGIDRLKIDRSFVSLLGSRSDGAAIVSAVVALSHGLGLATTAEGVETTGQRDFLVAAGCTDLQGFLFSKPEPIPYLAMRRIRDAVKVAIPDGLTELRGP